MTAQVIDTVFDPYQLISQYQKNSVKTGATASFTGSMRDFNEDASVSKMILEHYPAMTKRYLEKLEAQAQEKWALQACLIVHRVGEIYPGEAIVLIACWSAHRRAALDACAWLIEELKYNAPFWKKEQRPNGEYWVSENTNGH